MGERSPPAIQTKRGRCCFIQARCVSRNGFSAKETTFTAYGRPPMISGKRPSLRSRASASIRPRAMVGSPPASATLEANSGTSVIQDMAPWIKGYLIPISLATGLSRKQSFFASAERHRSRISAMKAFTAFSVPVPKRSANDAAKAASTPRGMTSSCVKWLSRGWRAAGLHLADEGTTAFVRDLCRAQRVLERLDLLERQRVPLVEKATGNLQVQANQGGGIHAELGELLALEIVHGHQVGQPVDALEDDAGGSGGQECRCRLRGPDAAPDEDVRRLRGARGAFPWPPNREPGSSRRSRIQRPRIP